ncbi:MAG TPA: ATP-dependent DNA helicase RecQ [Chitinophagaceae bacterium]|jgi:ATP-dependent DNA helicase RecQ|nr:ATP-dependent DNA helicase RecQ [Chitinophagaceae bacterium]
MPIQLSSHHSRLTIHDGLKQYWGYDSFRPLQEEIINSVLDGKDVLALMPTGGGKSLCYQVPGLAKEGLCLVISPLIALMKDQVENLRKKNITAYAIYSGMSRKEVINTLKVAAHSNCKFLYVSPERLETSLFKEYLPALDINLIAVDEAHCISQWGYDFRPPYLRIAALRDEVPNVPILALTASATTEVQDDICQKLQFKIKNIFRQSFERANLSFSAFKVDAKINKIIEILKNVSGSGIIYCKTRKRTKEVADLVKMHGMPADFYHAGLTQEERNQKQENWIRNKIRVIVCTNAFGMGIDKPDVRLVIHADAPDCLENYYQEAGRAGRDGKRSYAVLLYDQKDIKELEELIQLRYPSLEEIRQVYQSISNYLQIPSGGGEGQYYDFDITDFLKKFKHDIYTALYSLKALEQDEWLSFNEQVFLPSTVQFTTNKEYLYQFEKDQPQLEPLIKTLLRAYEGVFEYPASISEILLAQLLKKEKDEIKNKLKQLHSYSIIEYNPQKETPQLFFIRNRVKTEDLTINTKAYKIRKEKFTTRINSMVRYIYETTECRSKIIASYFGDDKIKDCGICDNCLKQKSIQLSKEEFNTINNRIVSSIKGRSIHTKELLQHLKGIKKEKAWKVINFLQAENKIELDKTGWIKLK